MKAIRRSRTRESPEGVPYIYILYIAVERAWSCGRLLALITCRSSPGAWAETEAEA